MIQCEALLSKMFEHIFMACGGESRYLPLKCVYTIDRLNERLIDPMDKSIDQLEVG